MLSLNSMLSLILPYIAFCLPLHVILTRRPVRSPWLYSVISFAAALGALCHEIWVFWRRAMAGDFAGICDTAGAVLVLCVVVAALTLILNLAALGIRYRENRKP